MQAFGRTQFQNAFVPLQIDRADLGHHVGRHKLNHAVETLLAAALAGHSSAQGTQKRARSTSSGGHGPSVLQRRKLPAMVPPGFGILSRMRFPSGGLEIKGFM